VVRERNQKVPICRALSMFVDTVEAAVALLVPVIINVGNSVLIILFNFD